MINYHHYSNDKKKEYEIDYYGDGNLKSITYFLEKGSIERGYYRIRGCLKFTEKITYNSQSENEYLIKHRDYHMNGHLKTKYRQINHVGLHGDFKEWSCHGRLKLHKHFDKNNLVKDYLWGSKKKMITTKLWDEL